jgi:hypothetical protein
MIRPSLRRIAVLALCVVVLVGSAALSAKPLAPVSPDSTEVSTGVTSGFWDTVWRFLVRVWTKTGSAGDPYGKPASTQGGQPATENGSATDPFGLPGN